MGYCIDIVRYSIIVHILFVGVSDGMFHYLCPEGDPDAGASSHAATIRAGDAGVLGAIYLSVGEVDYGVL